MITIPITTETPIRINLCCNDRKIIPLIKRELRPRSASVSRNCEQNDNIVSLDKHNRK